MNRMQQPITAPVPAFQHCGKGFTLIEIMVVMAIVALLAAIALPKFQVMVIQGHLDEAKPYLMSIAAKERLRYNERGAYKVYTAENDIQDELGVDLAPSGNFCFMVITSSFITGLTIADSSGTAVDNFEVWAVLRNSSTANTDTKGCTIDSNKVSASDWVTDAGELGGEGRVVVLHYPPPPNGFDGTASDSDGFNHDWIEGISVSNALQD